MCGNNSQKIKQNTLVNAQYKRKLLVRLSNMGTTLNFYQKTEKSDHPIYTQCNLNLNLLDYQKRLKVNRYLRYLNFLSQHCFIVTVTRPTMDHINTNSFIDSSITTKILKVNVSDHLTFFFCCCCC